MRKMNNLNEQILRMKSLMSEERLYGNLVKEEVVITEQTKGVKKAYSKMLRLVGDIMGAERKALNNINKKITTSYDDAIEKMRLGDGDAAREIFKQNENYIMGGQNSDNIMDLFALQNARLPKNMQIDKDILPDMVNMYQSMQKMINTSLANGWKWKDATKRFQKTLNLTDEQAEAAITIVLHNKPKLRKRLAYSTDDSKLLKRKDFQTKPDLSNSKLIKTQINAWDRSKKGLENAWEKISKELDNQFSMRQVNKITTENPSMMEKFLIKLEGLGPKIGNAIVTYGWRLTRKIFTVLFIRIKIPAVSRAFAGFPMLNALSKVASFIPLYSAAYASYIAYKFADAGIEVDDDGNWKFIKTRELDTKGRKKDGSENKYIEYRLKFGGMVVANWIGNHPYTMVLREIGAFTPFKTVAGGIRKDYEEINASMKQKVVNLTMCCPKSKLKPVDGSVTPDEALKNRIWNDKYAIKEDEACDYVNQDGYGCAFGHKPSCKEIYDYINSGDVSDDIVKEMNREGGMTTNNGDNYLTRMMKNKYEEWGFSSKDEVNDSSVKTKFKSYLSSINEETWCKMFYSGEEELPIESYKEAAAKALDEAFEATNLDEAYEAKMLIVQLGPVQMIYDEITDAMEGGKYPLYCDEWKSSPFIVGPEKPTKEDIDAFKERLDDEYGDLSDGIDGLATYYCKRMRNYSDKLKAIKEVDCKRAIVGACNGTSFDEIYKEELNVINNKKE